MNPLGPDDDGTADLLRRTLAAEAADVQPDSNALRAIRQRTGVDAPSAAHSKFSDSSDPALLSPSGSSRTNSWGHRGAQRPWALGALGAGLATAAVITAVVVIGDNSGGNPSGTPAAAPGHTTTQSPASTEPSPGTVSAPPTGSHPGVYDPSAPAADQVTMYYVGQAASGDPQVKPRLYPEQHTVQPNGGSPAVAAVHEFLTSTPIDPDYSSGWPEGVDVTSITENGGVTTIALKGKVVPGTHPDSVPYSAARPVALQAMLATAGVQGRANFTYNGEPVERILNQSAAVSRQSDEDTRAWVSITSPVEGQEASSPVTVTGSANVFEANVNWELLDADGQVIDSGIAMAGFTEWKSFTVFIALDRGSYTIRAFESSPKDGRPTYVDDKTFTIS